MYSDGEHAWGASRSDMERRKSRIQCWLAVGLGESRHVHTIDQPTITDRNFGSATMRNKKWEVRVFRDINWEKLEVGGESKIIRWKV